MKRNLVTVFLLLLSSPCVAQWVSGGTGDLSGNNIGSDFVFGVHDNTIFRSDSKGVWRHTDTGLHPWIQSDSGLDFTLENVTSFASLGMYMFVGMTRTDNGANGAFYRSSNDGTSWELVQAAAPAFTNGTYLFGNSFSSTYRSLNDGNTWQGVTCPLASNFAATGACIFATANGSIYRSTDSGTHWAQTTPPAGLSLSAFAVIGTRIFAGGTGVFRSTDSGASWPQHSLVNHTVNALASYGTYLFAGVDTGVYISSDSGMTWRNVSDSLGGGNILGNGGILFGHPDVTLLAVLDTTLFAEVYTGSDVANNQYGYVAARPISEMTNPDSTESVVQTISASDTIEIYPNPANGTVTILSGSTSILGVSMLNLLGEEVLTVSNARESEINLDISELASGTYFLLINTNGGSVTRRVIVTH